MPSLNTGNAILSNPIKVDSSYNVGIGGAASGSFKLQVTGTTNLTGALTGVASTFLGKLTVGSSSLAEGEIGIFETGGNYNFTTFKNSTVRTIIGSQSSTSQGFLGTASNHDLLLKTNDTTRLTIASSGAATFSGSSNSGVKIKQGAQIGNPVTSSDFYNGLTLENSSTTNAFALGYTSGGTFSISSFDGSSTYTKLLTISNGNVGIGTSSPSGRLMVYGSSAGNVFQNIVSNQGGATQVGINLSPAMSDGEVASNPAQASIYATDSNYGANIIFANKTTGAVGNSLTERMRITSGGQLYFSRNSGGTDIINIEAYTGFTGRGILLNMDAGSDAITIGGAGSQNAINVTSSSKKVIISNLGGSGTVTVQADNSGTLIKSSDSSLKQEDKEYKIQGLAEILQLQPRAYKWLKDIEIRKEEAVTEIGFFADEVNPIIPSAAPKGFDGLYGFNDRAVTAALVKAIQEMNQTIQNQQQQINSLINR